MNIYKTKKSSVFFSYSKDKGAVLSIKEKISEAIDNSSMIFVSSDEDSIPGGENYLEKIISALDDAKIIFLFITPQSYNSPWVHYEAGYAIAKGKAVIPLGINYKIESLILPLSTQQGKNINSADDLNYIIRCINKTLKTDIAEIFTEKDYRNIVTQIQRLPESDNSDAIEEKGDNANGTYIRFRNGQQICTRLFPHGLKLKNELATSYSFAWPAAFLPDAPIFVNFIGTEYPQKVYANYQQIDMTIEHNIHSSFKIQAEGRWK